VTTRECRKPRQAYRPDPRSGYVAMAQITLGATDRSGRPGAVVSPPVTGPSVAGPRTATRGAVALGGTYDTHNRPDHQGKE
jgi:hypothetical protein